MNNKIVKRIGKAFLEYYKKRVQKYFNSSLAHSLDTARKMLKNSKYCFLISSSERNWPSARMVQPIIELDTFVIWFGTNPTLRKIKEIQENPYVTIAFGKESENANLIIYGKATIETNIRERVKHWIGSWLLFFPSGPRGEDFVSIRVEPIEMELMNFKKYIVPEPFGLKPIKLKNCNGEWRITNME
ncbi:MAG: pyridoxamine 5'-phosphate oxidase family protein [Ignavibacteriaceae bacterium]|jgi:general stress protein 26